MWDASLAPAHWDPRDLSATGPANAPVVTASMASGAIAARPVTTDILVADPATAIKTEPEDARTASAIVIAMANVLAR